MPGQELRLGPFIGGLNTFSDPTAIADTELNICTNFEVGIDGSLVGRPPVAKTATAATPLKILLRARLSNVDYLIASGATGTYRSVDGVTWVLLNSSLVSADAAIQYGNKVYVYPSFIGTAATGITWDGTTVTVVATLPQCSAAITFKERAWIVPGPDATTSTSRLQFSVIADPASWNTGDATFIDINPGDGRKLIDLITYQDNIILFKEDSTFALAFDTVPTAAQMKKVNNIVGSTGKNCLVSFENTLFVYHRTAVYEIVNYQWVKINIKAPFSYGINVPASGSWPLKFFLTICGDRLLVRYYDSTFQFGLRTRTWTQWKVSAANAENYFGPLTKWPVSSTGTTYANDAYFGGSNWSGNNSVYVIQDGWDSTTTESATIICTMQTKNFDSAYGKRYRVFSFGQRFKKMHWWGIDVITNQSITGIATPIVTNFTVTWGMIKTTKWQDLGTWGQPISAVPSITTTYASVGSNARHFVKFPKGLRYRQINFNVQLQYNGTSLTGPPRLFGILNVMDVKEMTTKAVN